jgi:L-arabinonolactonase
MARVIAATLLVDCRSTLGEGILWWPERNALLWTDIEASRLWMHRLDAGTTANWVLPDRLGSMAICQSGRLLLGLAKGLGLADLNRSPDGGRLDVVPLVAVESDLRTRINDGRTDRSGNFVFGTMDDEEPHRPIGSFYQYSHRHGLRRLDLERTAVPNSICFSPDGGTMYFCDSHRHRIMQCEYDAERAAVSHVRLFAAIPAGGAPDGSVVDLESFLWNAEWGSALVRRYAADGTPTDEISLAAKNPTCVVFGGVELDRAFITSSRQEMTADELDTMPQAGGVFTAAAGVRGLLDSPFLDL